MNEAAIQNRPKFYNNIDGVGELGIGIMMLGFALMQWMQVHTPRESVWNRMYTLFIFGGVMGAIIHYGSKAIKAHITYPRTGFVEYRRRDTLWYPLLIGIVSSALLSIPFYFAIRHKLDLTSAVPLLGLVLAGSYGYGIARAVRWKWLVA